MDCIVLDAMGVIFRAADDVAELLIPFIAETGGNVSTGIVESTYLDASLGLINVDEFWRKVGLDSSVEDKYLARHALTPGIESFLACAGEMSVPVWCLSNDVERWSVKLRIAFNLENSLAGAIISSAVGSRKPNPSIYQSLLEASRYRADQLLFIDDRAKNVEAARSMGIPSVLFGPESDFASLERELREGTF
jgi:HAD superfamily hydrolase (TIGR01509 family)